MASLHGRAEVVSGVGRLLADARGGRGGAMVVCGGAGIGKTAVLQRAVQAHGQRMRVLATSGNPVEGHLDGAALHLMLQSVAEELDRLPAASAGALRRLTGLEPPRADPPALIADAMRALLADLARDTPVVCVADDWQWLDELSASVLSVLSERLDDLPVALLVATRGTGGQSPLQALPHLRLAGLDDEAARHLIDELSPVRVDPAVVDRMVAESAGVPALLSDEIDPAPPGLAWVAGFGYPRSPAPAALPASLGRALDGLPPSSRLLIAVATADPTGDPAVFRRAAGLLGLGDGDIAGLGLRGLLTIRDRVCFPDSGVRRRLYAAVSLSERREAHRVLAAAYDRPADRDRRAWHRALAQEAPLDTLAGEIVAALDTARGRGGHPAVAALLVHAARLSTGVRDRNQRLLQAADARRAAGDFAGAAELVDVVRHHASDKQLRLVAAAVGARVAFEQRRDLDSARALLAAATGAAEAGLPGAGVVLRDARAALSSLGRPGTVATPSTKFGRLTGHTPSLSGFAACWGPWHAYGSWPSSDRPDPSDRGQSVEHAEQRLRAARDAGDLAGMPDAIACRAVGHLLRGEFDALDRLAAEGERIAVLLGMPAPAHLRLIAAAWHGDELKVRRLTNTVRVSARARGDERLLAVAAYAQAVLLNAGGRYAEALSACQETDPAAGGLALWLPLELAEAAVRADRLDQAKAAVARLVASGSRAETAVGRGSIALGRALISGEAEADEQYRAAIAELSGGHGVALLARAHLLYGEWLRREGRKGEARTHLTTAETSLARLGATTFAARARREYSATGRRPRARRPDATGTLTAQEAIVAELVASGATNREIAEMLFLSLRTVEAHMRAIFAKLAITSRRQLVSRKPPAEAATPSAVPPAG
ncbi:AAA family ATPase [Actinoplanes sp. NPDC023936]|uniref:AAA family ATPase n=1 Tax=Actinoplanes sp. NPDC023936 TaxID=3154910 RepID=UPI0033E6802B